MKILLSYYTDYTYTMLHSWPLLFSRNTFIKSLSKIPNIKHVQRSSRSKHEDARLNCLLSVDCQQSTQLVHYILFLSCLLYNCHETSIIIISIKNCDVHSLEDYELLTKITNFIIKLQITAIFKYKIGIYIIYINKKLMFIVS